MCFTLNLFHTFFISVLILYFLWTTNKYFLCAKKKYTTACERVQLIPEEYSMFFADRKHMGYKCVLIWTQEKQKASFLKRKERKNVGYMSRELGKVIYRLVFLSAAGFTWMRLSKAWLLKREKTHTLISNRVFFFACARSINQYYKSAPLRSNRQESYEMTTFIWLPLIASDDCRIHFDEVIEILVSLNRKIKRLIINSFGRLTKVINLLELTVKQNILPTQSTKINTVLLPLIVEENFRIHFDELIKILISLSAKKIKAVLLEIIQV